MEYVDNEAWWISDINVAAAVSVAADVVVDGERVSVEPYPAVPVSFVRIEVVGKPKGRTPMSVYRGAKSLMPGEKVGVPVVVFGFRPFQGNHVVAHNKKRLWHTGQLLVNSDFATQHRLLRDTVIGVVSDWRKAQGKKPVVLKFKDLGYEVQEDGRRMIVHKDSGGIEDGKVRLD